jgi:hypothetical protein
MRDEFFSLMKYIPKNINGNPLIISKNKESLPSPTNEKPI